MITIKPLKQTMSCYKMLNFYIDNKKVGFGDTLVLNDINPLEYLKIMVHENGNIEIWTEDITGKETKINFTKKTGGLK